MQPQRIHDAVRRGAGRVAAAVGVWCDAYRADGPDEPLAPRNRFLRLLAAFAPPGGGGRPPVHGGATWWGSFDAAYTRTGDFIVRPAGPGADGGTWFIASQEPMLPVLCVRTTRLIDVVRPAGAAAMGVNAYGGAEAAEMPVLRGWPASLLAAGGRGIAGAEAAGDVAPGSWQVLLPALSGVVLRIGDVVSDDLGRRGVVASAELGSLGWRLLVRQSGEVADG